MKQKIFTYNHDTSEHRYGTLKEKPSKKEPRLINNPHLDKDAELNSHVWAQEQYWKHIESLRVIPVSEELFNQNHFFDCEEDNEKYCNMVEGVDFEIKSDIAYPVSKPKELFNSDSNKECI